MSDQLVSLIRTIVPIAVGSALTWVAAKIGFVLDEESSAALTTFVTGVAVTGYYTVARALEQVHPVFGYLLGSTRQPSYEVAPPK